MARVKMCSSCGNENLPERPFCRSCGVSLGDVEIIHAPTLQSTASEPCDSSVSIPAGTLLEGHGLGRSNSLAALRFPWGDVEVRDALFIGRDRDFSSIASRIDNDDYRGVSRKHAEIFEEDGSLFVRDLNSVNGTFVNDKKIDSRQAVRIQDGDRIRFSGRLSANVKFR